MRSWMTSLMQKICEDKNRRGKATTPTEKEQRPDRQLSTQEMRDLGGHYMRTGELDKSTEIFKNIYNNDKTRLHLGEYVRVLLEKKDFCEIERLAMQIDMHIFDSMRPICMHDFSLLERKIFLEICLESCQTPESIVQLSRAVSYVIKNTIPGDFVECGVYKGVSAVCIIRTLQELGVSDRDIWLYDTYEGMPKPESIDIFYAESGKGRGIKYWEEHKRNDGSGGSDWVYCPLDDVKKYVLKTGYPENRIHFIKGMVEDTIPKYIPKEISILRLDTDFYKSTKHELNHLFPLLVKYGVLIIDDYGAYRGAQQATDEYIEEIGFPVLLSRVNEHVRMFVKP